MKLLLTIASYIRRPFRIKYDMYSCYLKGLNNTMQPLPLASIYFTLAVLPKVSLQLTIY